MAEALLSPKEVADILSVTPGAVRNWVRTGQLKGYKAGRLIRVSMQDVEAFLEGKQSSSDSDKKEKAVKIRDYTSEEIAAYIEEDRIPSEMAERLGKILGL